MDAYIQTALGILVSIVLFLVGYRQTIGAKKERVQNANSAVHRAILRRMVLENYTPRSRDIARIVEGKAREFKVAPEDLNSESQILTQLFTSVFDNDFIAPAQRTDIEKRLDEVLGELIKEDEPISRAQRLPSEVRETRNIYVIVMGVATSMLGAVTALIYTLTKERFSARTAELFDIKLLIPIAGVFLASLASVAVISVLKRTRERSDEVASQRSLMQEGIALEREIANLLRKNKLRFQVQPQMGNFRPDFLFEVGGRKIAIEGLAASGQPPLRFLGRIQDQLWASLKNNDLSEIVVVTKAPISTTEGMIGNEGVRFLNIKELDTYLQAKKDEAV
jgi:hypothetical protein